MLEAVKSPYLVPFDNSFSVAAAPTAPPEGTARKKHLKRALGQVVAEIDDLQRRLYAADTWALLLVFQALDAGGKDGTIRAVMRGINPAGCQVSSFKKPSAAELDHDFLWRTARRLPERGRIGIFNRSHYEEVLVVRVHPEYLAGQRLPAVDLDRVWQERYESIRDHEKHLARNGTAIVKFWLNLSKEEQRQRFLSRLDEPEKHWKFSNADVEERSFWDDYQEAFGDALRATSRSWAPWYAIPADNKPFMRLKVAEIIAATLRQLGPRYPEVDGAERRRFAEMRQLLGEPSTG